MTAYATTADLRARAGFLSDAWGAADATPVDEDDLTLFLGQAAAEINARIGGFGFAVPVTDSIAVAALAGWNADLALEVALVATWPGGTGPESVADTLKAVQARNQARNIAIDKAGVNAIAALAYLHAQETNAASGVANFWVAEADYSPWLDDIESGQWIDYGAGLFLRGPIGPEYHKQHTRF